MSSGILSRWPVLVTVPLAAADRDDGGRLLEGTVERLFESARAAYFDRCTVVDPSTLQTQRCRVQVGVATVGSDAVNVSVNVVEVYPDRFTMMARVRPVGPTEGDGVAATAWCSLSPGCEVSNAMRDEFIALAQSATHVH